MKRLVLMWTLLLSIISVPALALIHDVVHPFHTDLHDSQPHSHHISNHQDAHSHHGVSSIHHALETWLCELYDVTTTQVVTAQHDANLLGLSQHLRLSFPEPAAVLSLRWYPNFWGRAPPSSLSLSPVLG